MRCSAGVEVLQGLRLVDSCTGKSIIRLLYPCLAWVEGVTMLFYQDFSWSCSEHLPHGEEKLPAMFYNDEALKWPLVGNLQLVDI